MDEGPELLARLDRIEALRAAGEPRPVILAEIRKLLAAGETAAATTPDEPEQTA
jgi:hypothetical protein